MFDILTRDNIATAGLNRFPPDRYRIGPDRTEPHAVLLRSFDLRKEPVPGSVLAVARAGSGVNNIPVEECSKRGIPVFNAPGANANAVKELTLAAMLLAARRIPAAWDFTRRLTGEDPAIGREAERNKKRFAGIELAGRSLGVIGLGAIGLPLANAAAALGMHVSGFDPELNPERDWELSPAVTRLHRIDELLAGSDFVSLHIPLNGATRGLIGAPALAAMRAGAILVNLARAAIVDETAICAALDSGRLGAYVCDFPSRALLERERAIVLPHIGASTREAEEKCAVIVADNLRHFLEYGEIRQSVNFPDAVLPLDDGPRLCIANLNVPGMVSQITGALAETGINIVDLLNKSRDHYAYTLVDLDAMPSPETLSRIRSTAGILSLRVIGPG